MLVDGNVLEASLGQGEGTAQTAHAFASFAQGQSRCHLARVGAGHGASTRQTGILTCANDGDAEIELVAHAVRLTLSRVLCLD